MREYVLVAYDISNPKRLKKVYKTMRGFGDRIQGSVFLCQISKKEEKILQMKLDDIIVSSEDQILIIRLGKKENISFSKLWVVIGKQVNISDNSILIF